MFVSNGVDKLKITLSKNINTLLYLIQEKINDIPNYFDGQLSF